MRMQPEGSITSPTSSDLSVNPDVENWFTAVDIDHSGKINSTELKAALINAQGKTFSDEACQLLINLFDKDKSGSIDLNGFQYLYTYVYQWADVFSTHDKDNSGYIEESELEKALCQMDYRLSNTFVKVLLENSCKDNVGKMSFDQFIVACVKLQRLTSAFRMIDGDLKGTISLGFEEFVKTVLEDFM